MCGFIGVLTPATIPDLNRAQRMRDTLAHRGPDDAGTWHDEQIVLGHRRLAVIDPSPEGHQPMTSRCGRYVLVYNGEIYNTASLRADIGQADYRGHSDTEVLLGAISRWGVRKTVERLVGMFAFAVWDTRERQLTLVRDRLGKKPLYYGWQDGAFVFASELSAIRAGFPAASSINRDALAGYLRHNYVTGTQSIITDVFRLAPAQVATLSEAGARQQQGPGLESYWSAQGVATWDLSLDAATDALHSQLRRAVTSRMEADVPLGAFLSGGIDSSLVCALLQEASATPIRTFTMGFTEPDYDESGHAKRIAEHLGCEHTAHTISESDLLAAVSQLPELLDEPFADASLIPTYVLSRIARESVTVALSGDGGDELFWGYRRYPIAERLNRQLGWLPQRVRSGLANALTSPLLQRSARGKASPGLMGRRRPLGGRLQTLATLVAAADPWRRYEALVSHWQDPTSLVPGGREPATPYNNPQHWSRELASWRRMQIQDLESYLPHDILTKVDRASMAVSLETRVPLLDHQLVEFCLSLPEHCVRGQNKLLLKRVLARYLPPALTERPKQGFSVPLDAWLRGPLKEWMLDLLSAERLRADGLFNPDPIQQRVTEQLDGHADWGAQLWDVLMFQAWYDHHGR